MHPSASRTQRTTVPESCVDSPVQGNGDVLVWKAEQRDDRDDRRTVKDCITSARLSLRLR